MDPSADSDLDALCADLEPNRNTASDPLNTGEPMLTTVELLPEFMHCVIAGYTTDIKVRLIMATLYKTSEEGQDAHMLYYIDKNLLYQQQVTPDGENRQLYIPHALVHDIFNNIHNKAGHQGFKCCLAGLKTFAMHKGAHLLKQYIRHCPHCQHNQTHHHLSYRMLQLILSPAVPYHTIILDFVLGLLCLPNSNNCVLTIIDKYTKQISLIPGKTTWAAMDWVKALLRFLMLADWGFLIVIISDRDKKFLSKLWQSLFILLAVALYFTTAYHPQSEWAVRKDKPDC